MDGTILSTLSEASLVVSQKLSRSDLDMADDARTDAGPP